MLKLINKKKEFYTDEVLYRYLVNGKRSTFVSLNKLAVQFKEEDHVGPIDYDKFLEMMKEVGITPISIKGESSVLFNEVTIEKLGKVLGEEVANELMVNLNCSRKVLTTLKDLKVKSYTKGNSTFNGITVEDLQKLTFSDLFWINAGTILTELSMSKQYKTMTLTFRTEKVTYVTASGVRAYCNSSGVADKLMVDDIVEKIHRG